ncbi:MAG: hypothetical protein ABR584_05410 [Candidatus Baltobacteraceae bacterium]
MTISRRESFVIHFYHDDTGDVFARVTESGSQETWTVRSAFQLRMMLAPLNPNGIEPMSVSRLKL